jgi:imidazolonepropionase-like amidohydrolase
VLLAASASAAAERFAVRADEVHLGDGRLIAPGVVLVEAASIVAVGSPERVAIPDGVPVRHCGALTPGLIALADPPSEPDARSVDPARRALDLVDRFADWGPWLESGVTALAVSPGASRLVPGRGAVLRLASRGEARVHLAEGPVHAVLRPSALSPPAEFVPNVPVNVDQPLRPARPQRPASPAAALGELRRLLDEARLGVQESEGGPAFRDVVRGRSPLVVHADRTDEIDAALRLCAEGALRLVLLGGTEAWKRADELASAGAIVLLTGAAAGLEAPAPDRGDWRPDTPALLASAGVPVALGLPADAAPGGPLLAAAAAVRAGLPSALAIAAVTGRAAEAAGAPDLGRIRAGGPADLVGHDGPPLALHARPLFVVVAGRVLHETEDEAEAPVLALRVGHFRTPQRTERGASLVLRDGRVASVELGDALPVGAAVRDYGPDSVLVPGFVDAFGRPGQEPGPSVPGGARLAGGEAVEADHASLRRALAAGVTSAAAGPWSRGPLRGRVQLVSTCPLPAEAGSGSALPGVETLAAERSPLLLWLDEGPDDAGTRQDRLRALGEIVRKAKAYHEAWSAHEKPAEKKAERGDARRTKRESVRLQDPRNDPGRRDAEQDRPARGRKPDARREPPEKNPELEPWRGAFRGTTPVWLRAGRADSIRAGLAALAKAGLKPVLLGGEEADLVASELAEKKVPVVLDPMLVRLEDGDRLLVAERLRRSGVAIAFASFGVGETDRLPLRAAQAVRLGLAPSEALRALTLAAGEVLGASEPLGRLAAGDRADCVVYSGDPFEPASRILAVVVRGRIVHEWGDDLSGLGQ